MCMEQMNALQDCLEQAREIAKRLISEASASNDFATVTRVGAIAERVDQIIAEAAFGGGPSEVSGNHSSNGGIAVDVLGAASTLKAVHNAASGTTKPARSKNYLPTFLLEGTDLVKVGQSRSSPDLYEHRAPRSLVESVVKAVKTAGGAGKRFGADVVLKQVGSGQATGNIPAYQVYVALAWLKWSGLIIQHGRQGYTVALPRKFGELVWSAWDQLRTR